MSLDIVIETGSYTGNGGTSTVTIGWQPALVVIHSTAGTAANRALSIKSDSMPGDDFMECGTVAIATTTNGITLTSTGFQVGSDAAINTSTQTYYWMAIRTGPWIDTGSYVGNSAPGGQNIVLGRQPDMVLMCSLATIIKAGFISEGEPRDYFYETQWTRGAFAPNPVVLTATGFNVSNLIGDEWNTSGLTHHYVAFPNGSTRHLETGFQSAAGSGTVTITTGKQPKAVWIWSDTRAGFKTADMPGDDAGKLDTQYSWDTASMITINSNGFTIGADFNVSAADVYTWLAWYD